MTGERATRSARGRAPPGLPGADRVAAARPAERLALFATTSAGLSAAEVLRRRAQYGANEPVRRERRHLLRIFSSNFTHTLALLLWFAAAVAFVARAPELGVAIIAVVVINGVFAFVQELRAGRVMESLMRRASIHAEVVREGKARRVPAWELVPGDVVRLRAGDIVPADCALVASEALTIDLSLITGESQPVERDAAAITASAERARAEDLACVAPAGAAVITGTAEGLVIATGPDSTMGRITALVASAGHGVSILERQLARLSRLTAVIAVVTGAATLFVLALLGHTTLVAALTFATGAIVALVPEGLLPTLSVALAVGARRMARRNAAVRRLSAVEIIGSATVICTDKTGTLTQNTLSVEEFVPARGGGVRAQALLAAALCNDAQRSADGLHGDPLDVALLRWAAVEGFDVEDVRRRCPRVAEVPFDPRRRYMRITCEVDGRRRDFVKGAPEAVLALSGGDDAGLGGAIAEAAATGERVLLIAAGEPLRPVGLFRLHDPPRPGAADAIAACRRAGVRVIVLTGDHPLTARAVARTIGLGDDLGVTDGTTLGSLDDSTLRNLLSRDAVVARIDPEGKLRVVSLLRREGEIVVVTGDGINDAPALRAADVGVAMGRRGTEVAKQAADMILSDDDFATIVAAVEEGRSIKENIRRFVSYVFTSNVAELVPFVVFAAFQVPLPLTILQVLAIDLGTDLLPALALGAEPPSPGIMQRRCEPPERPLLTLPLGLKTFLWLGLLESALGMIAYFGFYAAHGWHLGAPLAASAPQIQDGARTLTFLGIVSGQIGCLFALRDGSLRERLSFSNPWIAAGLGFELALTVALVYLPGVNRLFSMGRVPVIWLLSLPGGAIAFVVADLLRRRVQTILGALARRRHAARGTLAHGFQATSW